MASFFVDLSVKIFDPLLGWAVAISPLTGLFVVAFLITLISTLIYKYKTDQEVLKSLKQEMKDIKKELMSPETTKERRDHLQKISLEKSMQQFKHSMKPTLWTSLPSLLVILWLREAYAELSVSFLKITSWFWIYIIFAIVISTVLRKLLKVH